MKLDLFGNNKKVLLVGEGNFSFAVTLMKHNLNIDLTATCYENYVLETGKKNIDILKNSGIRVITGVDGTKLEKYEIFKSEYFDIVVFNFPHVGGKMRIEKNRELIRKFFMSAESILKEDGQIFMSLCDGQGGTPADHIRREWNDSWQVTEMAAHGNFVLVAIEPFDSSLFSTYTVTGYRSLEKQFNTHGSITYIFKLTDRPSLENIAPKNKIDLGVHYGKSISWKDVVVGIDSDADNISNSPLYPNTYKFDITFTISPEFNILKFYEILYNHAGLLIDNVQLINSYTFDNMKETITFRITYISKRFPLHRKLVIYIHQNTISDIIEKNLNVIVSR